MKKIEKIETIVLCNEIHKIILYIYGMLKDDERTTTAFFSNYRTNCNEIKDFLKYIYQFKTGLSLVFLPLTSILKLSNEKLNELGWQPISVKFHVVNKDSTAPSSTNSPNIIVNIIRNAIAHFLESDLTKESDQENIEYIGEEIIFINYKRDQIQKITMNLETFLIFIGNVIRTSKAYCNELINT